MGGAEGQLVLARRIISRLIREYFDGERYAAATIALMNEELASIEKIWTPPGLASPIEPGPAFTFPPWSG